MIDDIARTRPFLTFLSQQAQQRIYQAALEILDSVGMQILHDGTISLLKDAGCRVGENGIVKIPSILVENALKTAPNNIPVYNREGEHVMDLGGDRSYFGTGSDLMYSIESERFERHRCSPRRCSTGRGGSAMPCRTLTLSCPLLIRKKFRRANPICTVLRRWWSRQSNRSSARRQGTMIYARCWEIAPNLTRQ